MGDQGGPTTFALQERRAADGSLVRAFCLRHRGHDKNMLARLSPDARAMAILPLEGGRVRITLF